MRTCAGSAKASILNETFVKIKSVFGVEKIFASETKIDTNQDFALKANYKTLSISGEKYIGGIDTTSYTTNKYANNKDELFLGAEVGPMRTSTDDELIDSNNIQVYEVKGRHFVSNSKNIQCL